MRVQRTAVYQPRTTFQSLVDQKTLNYGCLLWKKLSLNASVANHNEKKQQGFDFILKNQSDSIHCTSNHKNSETNKDAKTPHGVTETIDSNGLVACHTYALIEVARLDK